MFKKSFLLLLLSINLSAIEKDDREDMTTRQKVVLGLVLVVVGAIAAPFVLPAATITAIQATAVAASAKVVAVSAAASATVGTAVTSGVGTAVGTVAGPALGASVGSAVGGCAATATGTLISMPTIIGVGIVAAKEARPYLFETEEEELAELLKQKTARLLEAKTNFQSCLMKNKNDVNKGSFGCSKHCQDTAYTFGLFAGPRELERVIKDAQS